MKVIVVGKAYFVRHWFRWYRVQRDGASWTRLEPIIKYGRPARKLDSIEHAAASLRKSGIDTKPPIDLT